MLWKQLHPATGHRISPPLGKIVGIVCNHYVGIKRVSAMLAIAIGIVQADFFLFAHC